MTSLQHIAEGAEAGRRVAWAKYFAGRRAGQETLHEALVALYELRCYVEDDGHGRLARAIDVLESVHHTIRNPCHCCGSDPR